MTTSAYADATKSAPAFALSLRLTNRAARSAVQLLSDEAGDQLLEDADLRDEATVLLHTLFGDGRGGLYDFQMQNGGQGREGDTLVNLWLTPNGDDGNNASVLRRLQNWPLVLMGTSQLRRFGGDGTDFLVIDLFTLPPWSVDGVSDALSGQIAFDWNGRFATGIPPEVHAGLRRLPVRRLHRNRVRLLLDDWGRFLEIRAEIAAAGRFALDYAGTRLDDAGRRARFQVQLPEDFDQRKVHQAKGEDLHLDLTPDSERLARALDAAKGGALDLRDGPGEVLGEIRGLQGHWLEVRLDQQIAARIRAGRWTLPKKGHLQYRAVGELAQVRRLRWGLESLLRGRATNDRLGEFLFDPYEAALPDDNQAVTLSAGDLLQPHLNAGQLRAVEGALSAPDLYLIQGPPGTGKTTVIAEICYQVAKRGGRTLVASQANLAVDNAMSKLVHDPAIRALRRGRAESVEEEGQPYLEDYVIGTWLEKVATDCQSDLDARTRRGAELAQLLGLREAIDAFEVARSRYGSEIRPARAAADETAADAKAAQAALAGAESRHEGMQLVIERLEVLVDGTIEGEPLPAGWVDPESGAGEISLTDLSLETLRALGLPVDAGLEKLAVLEDAVARWLLDVADVGAAGGEHGEDTGSNGNAGGEHGGDTGSNGNAEGEHGGDAGSNVASSFGFNLAASSTFLTDYVTQARRLAAETARIRDLARAADPQIEALDLLCRRWYELLDREAPLLAQREARLAAPAARQARIADLETEITQREETLAELTTLIRDLNNLHRGIASWLLRRATADVPIADVPPALESGRRRQLWDAAVRDQRLPSLRGIALRAREAREAGEALGRMVVRIERCVARLEPEVSPRVLAAAERRPPSWRETALAGLVSQVGTELLRPAEAAEVGLRPILQATLNQALAKDSRRLPERRIAANIVGLRTMVDDLRASQVHWTQMATSQVQDLRSVLNRLAARLSSRLRSQLVEDQDRQTAAIAEMHQELADLRLQADADREDDSEQIAALDALAREKSHTAEAIRDGIDLDGAADLAPLQRVVSIAQDALVVDRDTWDVRWQAVRDQLATELSALGEAVGSFDPDAVLSEWHGAAEDARAGAEGALAAAASAAAAAAEAHTAAEAEIAGLEAAHSAARDRWLAAYEALPDELRPDTQSPTSSATLDALRAQCADWEAEHEALEAYLDSYGDFIADWIGRVGAPNAQDEADLRQIYIDNANVIGITCVQAGSRAFSQRYRNFDTVIIDEVSKATPPELLLPMLKGASVVLVGDSRQLPPMVGSDALRDLAQSLDVGARDLSHLERSLFRDLFERAPVAIKSWLTDQYRMHPQIMDAINQFYHDKLACRIPDPDLNRAHGMAPLIPEETHIAWIPTPWAPPFYESRVGTSRRNDKEVEIIANLVARMDDVWGASAADRPAKEIGVITFYAAQESALRARLLGRGGSQRYQHLDVRLGTVDRFQGMEKPIIIVSLVCNNARRDIGFARALERINVAFSRAQELLVIVGSRELFCREASAVKATARYARVADVVADNGGMLNVADYVNH